ncbi:MAG: hypothetical protein J0L94_06390 [Rhodothermia bacterium]|nr:hypothetical protein [Rhodothermia bacterium]
MINTLDDPTSIRATKIFGRPFAPPRGIVLQGAGIWLGVTEASQEPLILHEPKPY